MSVENTLREQLRNTFEPQVLEITNESHMHSVPANSETHFKLVLVSESFNGQRKVSRHQAVYAALADLLAGPIHALAMHLYDPEEWQLRDQSVPASPECLGGSKAEGAA